MKAFDAVTALDIAPRRISTDEAKALRQRLLGESPRSILEVCQDCSQITLYLAAILADQGEGTLTSFRDEGATSGKSITKHLGPLGLSDRISALPSGRSYTWALQRMLSEDERPTFDICVLNGNKTWDTLGMSVLLADMLLRPGGLMILPDVHWSMATSPYFKQRPQVTEKYAADQVSAQPVQRLIDLVLPRLGYTSITAPELKNIALARKK